MDLSNVFSTGGMVTGIGLLIVFGCLIALIVIMEILPKIFNIRRTKNKADRSAKKSSKAPVQPAVSVKSMQQEEHDYELIAVLTASAAAMMDTRPGNIIIRSYKRMGPSAWKKSGRDYQIFHKI